MASHGRNGDTSSGDPDSKRTLWRTIRKIFDRVDGEQSLRAQLEEAIDEHEEDADEAGNGDLQPIERQMIRKLLHFSELDADDVAIPRGEIIAMPASAPWEDIVRAFAEHGHSRMPVYGESLDDVVGMVLIKDVFRYLAEGRPQRDWKTLLRRFWQDFHAATQAAGELRTTAILDHLNEALGPHIFPDKSDGSDPRECPLCHQGQLSLKTSRFGAFIGCSRYPECKYTRPVASPDAADGGAESGDRELGVDPATGQPVHLKIGRFGPYVETTPPDADKPKRSSLPKGWSPASIDLEKALRLLSLPRDVGPHPEDGKMITASLGRYGPFVAHAGTYANVADIEEVFDVGLNRAVALLAEKRAGRAGRASAAAPLKELGAHPETGEAVQVMAGRYGPYVKSGKINATLPKGTAPEDMTMEAALPLLAAKAGAAPKKKAPAKKAAAKKPTAKKEPAAKKPAAKKAPAKKTAEAE